MLEMKGTEYLISDTSLPEQGYYLIEKRNRKSPTETTLESLYFIVNGIVFAAPNFKTIFDLKIEEQSLAALNLVKQIQKDVDYDFDQPSSFLSTNAGREDNYEILFEEQSSRVDDTFKRALDFI